MKNTVFVVDNYSIIAISLCQQKQIIMAAKKVIQRSVPLNQRYEIVSSFYQSLEDGGGTICENCGRLITNVATIKGQSDGRMYAIGMDCAETITSIKDEWELHVAKVGFAQAKGARAAILKMIKKAKELGIPYEVKIKTHETEKNFYKEIGSGMWTFNPLGETYNPRVIGQNWKQYPKEGWDTHVLPMIKDLATS